MVSKTPPVYPRTWMLVYRYYCDVPKSTKPWTPHTCYYGNNVLELMEKAKELMEGYNSGVHSIEIKPYPNLGG